MLKKMTSLGLIPALCVSSMVPLLQGCDDEEVAAGAAVVAVGAAAVSIGAAIDDDDHHRPHHGGNRCHDGRKRICRTRYDYRGYEHRECRWVRCDRPDWRHYSGHRGWIDEYDLSAGEQPISAMPIEDIVNAEEFGTQYGMSTEAAQRVIDALKIAKNGKLDGLKTLGFSHEDLNKLAQLKYPSDEGINKVAQTLNQYPRDTRAMVSSMIAHGFERKRELEARGRTFD